MDVPIDKIKVNNAVVFFFIIVTCAFCPLTLLLDVDYKIFFNYDLIKISIALIGIGCTQFGIVYVSNAFGLRMKTYKDENPLEENVVNYLIRNPLVNTSLLLVLFYGTLIILFHIFNTTLEQAINILIYMDMGIVFGTILDVVFFSFRKKPNKT